MKKIINLTPEDMEIMFGEDMDRRILEKERSCTTEITDVNKLFTPSSYRVNHQIVYYR